MARPGATAANIRSAPDLLAREATFRLLNDFQRGFPIVGAPFAAVGDACGLTEDEVLATLRSWTGTGVVSRVGAVFAPRRVGASALAALAAPIAELDAIAARVNAIPEVNHNYQREHAFNLWFVVTAASAERLGQIVADIERDTACRVIVLPLEEEFHIDLGFDLAGGAREKASAVTPVLPPIGERAFVLGPVERRLITGLQAGLSLEPRPFAALARGAGLEEAEAIGLIRRWLDDGLIKRFGVVVRHHELGFRANAMCVWDVPDEQVAVLGHLLAREPAVTLCYRRTRVPPHWRYNLFCMIHGKSRDTVQLLRNDLAARLELDRWQHAVLFSCRRFKQHGARYLNEVVA
ncbi:MAG: Lrp/AsnC family transcriptional regulator [Aromatoleum sp.]|jgi:DNA-binding Lrp family transcriptional regulator|uniref:siroheme decarboxylase subunit beta n=1 Tax=Aromatoleum sp. TaxID=2307007 RepID=UPI002893A722|nr:Lrp/AsnC family transcriptional regulator [Aromatoleum sp.]MDT3669600.1 Lrp/AsnC family transcriptional regulator [Aromatoleum sp.]